MGSVFDIVESKLQSKLTAEKLGNFKEVFETFSCTVWPVTGSCKRITVVQRLILTMALLNKVQ